MRIRLALASVLSVILVVTLAIAVPQNLATKANAFAGGVISAADVESLAETLAKRARPAGSETLVYLAPADSEAPVVTAAANAASTGSIMLLASDNPSRLLDQLSMWKVTEIVLVGPESRFDAATISAVEAKYQIDRRLTGAKAWEWSEIYASSKPSGDVYLADPGVKDSLKAAAVFATQSGGSVMVVQAGAGSDVARALNVDGINSILRVGDVSIAGFVGDLDQSAKDKLGELNLNGTPAGSPRGDLGVSAATSAFRTGGATTQVIVGSDDESRSMALAGLFAHLTGRVYTFGATSENTKASAYSYLRMLGPETTEILDVGVSATTADRAAWGQVAATVTRHEITGFRTYKTTYDGTNTTVTVSKVSGADGYEAYDATGKKVAGSTTTVLKHSGPPIPLQIIAFANAGGVVGTLQHKVSPYVEKNKSAFITGSTPQNGPTGTTPIRFQGGAGIPRIVSRAEDTTPGTNGPMKWTPLALTCESAYADASLSHTTDVYYKVETLPATSAACPNGHTGPAGRTISQFNFPADASAATNKDKTDRTQFRASESRVARATRERIEAANSGARTPNSPLPVEYYRYNTFIPTESAWGLVIYSDGKFKVAHGDNRSFDAKGSFRTQLDAKVTFGTNHGVTVTKRMGETIAYACPQPRSHLTDCEERERAKAPLSGLSYSVQESTTDSAEFTLVVHAANPTQPAPAIDGAVHIIITPQAQLMWGGHDAYPSHEIYYGGWDEWYDLYQEPASSFPGPACLAGAPIGICTRDVLVTS